MSEGTVEDRAILARLVLAKTFRHAWRGALFPLRGMAGGRGRAFSRLLIAPQDIRTADPTVAADIYSGYFVFEGKAVNANGHSPFLLPPPSPAWAASLAGFGWLRHLRAADTSLAQANARALVTDWIALNAKARGGPAWEPTVVARRLLAWLSQSPIVLEGADGLFYRRFMRSLGRQTAVLGRMLDKGLRGEARLLAALALTEVGLCAEGCLALHRRGSRILVEEIGRQILPDGGHVSRNPDVCADLLLDFLPLREAYAARGAPVPPPLLNAIDRMLPMVRCFRHGDGTLALFNGMGVTEADALATILAHDDARGRPLSNAPHSGYQRLEAGAAVLIVDTGRPPPLAFSERAHAGTLAFEFSIGAQRFVVNCGAPPRDQPGARDAARATAAHSTLVLADHSSSRFASATAFRGLLGGVLYAGPTSVGVERTDTPVCAILDGSHDGYLQRLGFVHQRRLVLDASGGHLAGEDRLVPGEGGRQPSKPLPFAIRFHLHHALRTTPIHGGLAVLVAFPNGERWTFEAGGLPVTVEESISFSTIEGPRRIEQLVIHGYTRDSPGASWSLSRAADR